MVTPVPQGVRGADDAPTIRNVLGGTMRTRTAISTVAAVVLLAGLAGCSSATSDKPTPTATVTKTKAPGLTAEEARAECVEAWADVIGARPDDFDPETDSDPEPEECKGLPESQWTDRYMDGLEMSNERGRAELQRRLEEAEAEDAAGG